MIENRAKVDALAVGLGPNPRAARENFHAVAVALAVGVKLADAADRIRDIFARKILTPTKALLKLLNGASRETDGIGVAGELQLVTAQGHAHAEEFAELAEMPIRRPGEGELLFGMIQGNREIHNAGG